MIKILDKKKPPCKPKVKECYRIKKAFSKKPCKKNKKILAVTENRIIEEDLVGVDYTPENQVWTDQRIQV